MRTENVTGRKKETHKIAVPQNFPSDKDDVCLSGPQDVFDLAGAREKADGTDQDVRDGLLNLAGKGNWVKRGNGQL